MDTLEDDAVGFNTDAVYRTYDEFATKAERCYIEYFLRDAYEFYGYDFHYYDGKPMDMERVRELISHFDVINFYMRKTMLLGYTEAEKYVRNENEKKGVETTYETTPEEEAQRKIVDYMKEADAKRLFVANLLMKGIRFLNENGYPLKFMPMLKLDPALMERPLYH